MNNYRGIREDWSCCSYYDVHYAQNNSCFVRSIYNNNNIYIYMHIYIILRFSKRKKEVGTKLIRKQLYNRHNKWKSTNVKRKKQKET